MRRELEEKLFKKYPKLFCGKDKPITENLMFFGFECGDGWYWLVDNLCDSIQGYVDSRNGSIRIRKKAVAEAIAEFTSWQKLWYKIRRFFHIGNINHLLENNEEEEWQVEAFQVKEKFGGLRFYINYGDDYVYGMIRIAEVMSKGICEMCGTTKNVTDDKTGWIKFLCPKCHKQFQKDPLLILYP